MLRKSIIFLSFLALAASGIAAAAYYLKSSEQAGPQAADPRTTRLLVKVAKATSVTGVERGFTGTIAAKVQSNLGFRVPGKIVERFVDVGQEVKTGQPLMRIDETDLRLALTAKRNAVLAARAVFVQARADEKRYATLVDGGIAASPQRYEQARAAKDTAEAQLAAAEAEAKVAENEATYSTLVADADGTVVAALGEPGQVVAAGQTVVQLAHAGPREALVSLPETIRPAIGSTAEASVYGKDEQQGAARLRQISNSADIPTRTYEARYVLEGEAASAPLGATVTIRLKVNGSHADVDVEVEVPIGAVLDEGNRTGVWILDQDATTVRFAPVAIKRLGEETAVVTGIKVGQPVVALGAHLLTEGATVRTSANTGEAN